MSDTSDYSIFDPMEIPYEEISDPDALVKEPLISVNMITYNHAPYIAQAIEGVLQQETNFPFELVIGEDCSTDGTREIVFDYQKKHPDVIRVIAWDKNVGASKNSIQSQKACRGKYIAFCEGDDYWHHPKKLQKQIEFLETHPDYGLVHSEVRMRIVKSGQIVESSNRSWKKMNQMFDNDSADLFLEILVNNYAVRTPSVCVRKKLLDYVVASDPVAFESDRFMSTDRMRWLELSRLTRFKYIDEPLATYNQLPESLSRSTDVKKRTRFKLAAFDMLLYYADKYGYTDKLPKSRWDHYTYPLLCYSYRYQDAKMAVRVKEKRKHLPFEQRLLYWGSIYPVIHLSLWPLVYSLLYLKMFIRKLVRVVGRSVD
jgi:glycosyltransferase involved in cell wall biosynthesis